MEANARLISLVLVFSLAVAIMGCTSAPSNATPKPSLNSAPLNATTPPSAPAQAAGPGLASADSLWAKYDAIYRECIGDNSDSNAYRTAACLQKYYVLFSANGGCGYLGIGAAKPQQNPADTAPITFRALYQACIVSKASVQKDDSGCDALANLKLANYQFTQNSCISAAAIAKKDASLCQKIPDGLPEKDYCLEQTGVA